ncbi:UNVERIFIED_ORG: N-acetyl-gamma-glutamyl-phosphate reductase [Pseudomonas parafulva]|jgi:N-acetyl-gamma-glutamyl-phosphate reductase|uniref:N-acetyl-gamma-glutamyl-phosphate reductase n=1 Tax=Pseudomonas TaxID=286 RepID=UPI000EE01E72|nr:MULTISPECIES: N-acetyl-gamma-glutamyl-phosphate reductase [Pseudomonas]MDP9557723.1 N-acetyl-gamma-glutamyl-phosphate reductase [Pseudomonas parafulva]MDP9663958.1 N-acetyl-gamma-glutamyl-phosphate reductase [Pseudomonas cremoricolorata]HCL53701.1 N-acetyl-gamma-glutamyl-phosphate reductase [Pseudomonas sp.]MBN6790305.1 N-acetyl-gamma-glutamyl-phosphate reductase [Pseudomonas fulva]MBN6795389.1 N-acetyl-gamma-glutamyl-phosphate reductase [Pseudomonas fulva]
MHLPLVFIDGDQGTTGLQIHARLHDRKDLRLLTLADAQRKDLKCRSEAINRADIAILCLPDDAAREAVSVIDNPGVRVIDASSAHRTAPGWTYGFAELNRDQAAHIGQSTRVSNPGCYPTGAIALLGPLIAAGLVPADYPLAIHAISGYSGGGRAAVQQHEQQDNSDASAVLMYGLDLAHKHVPEIQVHAGLSARPMFMPAYGAYRQGIVLSIALHLRMLPGRVSAQQLQACLEQHYQGARHVKVMPLQTQGTAERLDPQALNGTDDLRLALYANPSHGQVLLTAVFDNLGKGAAGAAVQNLDLMLYALRADGDNGKNG